MTRFIRFMPVLFCALALILVAAPGTRAAPKFLGIGQSIDTQKLHRSYRFRPPFAPDEKQLSLGQVAQGKPLVLLFVDATKPHAQKEISALQAAFASATRVQAVVVAYGRDESHISQSLNAIQQLGVTLPILIDTERFFAFQLAAFRPPHYAVFDAQGKLVINKISSLDNPLQNGQTLRQALAQAEMGANIAVSDGEMRRDITTMVGADMPAFSVERPEVGKAPYQVRGSKEVQASGKPALFVFWVATCPHCQREMPRIWDWYSRHKDEVELLAITRMDKPSMVNYTRSYLEKKNLRSMPVYNGSRETFEAFRVEGFPSWAFVDAKGKIIEARTGEDRELETHLDQALSRGK